MGGGSCGADAACFPLLAGDTEGYLHGIKEMAGPVFRNGADEDAVGQASHEVAYALVSGEHRHGATVSLVGFVGREDIFVPLQERIQAFEYVRVLFYFLAFAGFLVLGCFLVLGYRLHIDIKAAPPCGFATADGGPAFDSDGVRFGAGHGFRSQVGGESLKARFAVDSCFIGISPMGRLCAGGGKSSANGDRVRGLVRRRGLGAGVVAVMIVLR
jgi:hypothetical protein